MKPIKHEDLGDKLSGQVIGAAMAVHRKYGPGLDEADYERALHLELLALGIEHECQVSLPLFYKGTKLDCGYRMDLVILGSLLLELKAVDKLHPIHEAQLLTYLRLAQLKLGLLMNFNVLRLKEGILRRANSASSKRTKPGAPKDHVLSWQMKSWTPPWKCKTSSVQVCYEAPTRPASPTSWGFGASKWNATCR